VVETRAPCSLFGPPGHGGLSRRPHDAFGMLTRVVLTQRTQALREPDVSRHVAYTHAARHTVRRLEQSPETLTPLLIPLPARACVLRMIHERMRIALQRLIAAG
jgi:hypothetical protein